MMRELRPTRTGKGLPRILVERALERLGLNAPPAPDGAGLAAIYAAWCRRVPFDNSRKLIHLRHSLPGPLPGDTAEDFLSAWLQHGTGGTCWAGNGALQALLRAVGFEAQRGLGTMLASPNAPPNHGTVIVRCEGRRFMVDASILHGEPLPLEESSETTIEHPAWGVRCARSAGHWRIRWRPLHAPQGIDCRIERLRMPLRSFPEYHERSRPWSPFNFSIYARVNRGDETIGIAFGQRIALSAGGMSQTLIEGAPRREFLIDGLGLSEAIVAQLPPDLAMAPPPQPPPR
jgi:hypothetical protein